MFQFVLDLEKITFSTIKISPNRQVQWAITEMLIIAKIALFKCPSRFFRWRNRRDVDGENFFLPWRFFFLPGDNFFLPGDFFFSMDQSFFSLWIKSPEGETKTFFGKTIFQFQLLLRNNSNFRRKNVNMGPWILLT